MRYRVYEELREGVRAIVLEDRERDSLAVVLPSVGCNAVRVRLDGCETIEGPPGPGVLAERSSEFGVPLLWPPGRIPGGKFMFRGREYDYPVHEGNNHLHGEIRMRPWRVVSLEANDADGASVTAEYEFRPSDGADSKAGSEGGYYPFAVRLTLAWRLRDGRIEGELDAFNWGAAEAPFGFGLHPYFSFKGTLEEVEFSAPVVGQYRADGDGVFRRAPVRTELCESVGRGVTLDRLPPEEDHFVFRLNENGGSCRIIDRSEGVRIGFEFGGGFPYLIVFKPAWADALSLEPWSCLSDAYRSPLGPEWTGAEGLAPGERKRLSWAWRTE